MANKTKDPKLEQDVDRGLMTVDWESILKEKWHKFPEVEGENKRFLIFCGHNLCEDCFSIYYGKMHFTCAICAGAALPFPKDDIGFYGRKCQSRSSMFEEVLSVGDSNSGEIKQIVCSECGYRAASGKCKTCNVHFCTQCFDKLHIGSRVLGKHVFYPSKIGQRIGNEIFPLPIHLMCKLHRVPGTAFCVKCMSTICQNCQNSEHATHVTHTVREMNHCYSTEIPAAVKSIETVLKLIENAQLVLKANKEKLKEFSGNALVKILNHFSKIYDLVQKLELETLQNLRKSSLSLQLPINLAIAQLRDYKELLMNMRQVVYNGDSDQIKVPHDVMLDELLTLIHEHLQKIPTTVEVTNVDVSPYNVTIKNHLLKQIRRSIKCQIMEPKVEVRLNNEYDHKIIITRSCQPPNIHDLMRLNRETFIGSPYKKTIVEGCFGPKFNRESDSSGINNKVTIPRPWLSNDEQFSNRMLTLVINQYGSRWEQSYSDLLYWPKKLKFSAEKVICGGISKSGRRTMDICEEHYKNKVKSLTDLLPYAPSMIKNACLTEEKSQQFAETIDKDNTVDNPEDEMESIPDGAAY